MTNIREYLITYDLPTQELGPYMIMNNYDGNYIAKWKNYLRKRMEPKSIPITTQVYYVKIRYTYKDKKRTLKSFIKQLLS